MRLLLLLLLITGCQQQQLLVNPNIYDQDQVDADHFACETAGYATAGGYPQRQYQQPNNTNRPASYAGGVASGLEKGMTAGTNAAATRTWNAAFSAGYRACMYERGYRLQD